MVAAVLTLEAVGEARLPISHGGFAHAAALDLFLRLDPALARTLHDDSPAKPFTVSPLLTNAAREGPELLIEAGTECSWRITGLSEPVSSALVGIGPAIGGIRIGSAIFAVKHMALAADEDGSAGRDTYAGMYERWREAQPLTTATIQFITPTTFRAGRFEQPFPAPRLVFGHLTDQWNAHSGIPLGHLREVLDQAIVLSNWKGETRRVELCERRTVGFVGRFTYRASRGDPALQRLVSLLSNYALYSGVGWQTTHGMGQVRLLAPPTPGAASEGGGPHA